MTQFYSQLPILTEFADIGQPHRYTSLPADWHVVMCDVRNSTAAVEAGRCGWPISANSVRMGSWE